MLTMQSFFFLTLFYTLLLFTQAIYSKPVDNDWVPQNPFKHQRRSLAFRKRDAPSAADTLIAAVPQQLSSAPTLPGPDALMLPTLPDTTTLLQQVPPLPALPALPNLGTAAAIPPAGFPVMGSSPPPPPPSTQPAPNNGKKKDEEEDEEEEDED
ncbi:uncharacterized protein BX663DRAFT_505581 [Cokeromyces recurvatus]|uniref:uncharacterized protein n=1 Tax=Cokeromyces recurvatus TaxID=90255 RepID=UPI0022212479|nr:uncharacterized protein BX663DRAFT_505581 [Cokeromyces recurvatus]KAI7903893.1 hypothetical protein BX663DRAFT_505581 [Cokeromyces recurvatus]